MAEMPQDRCEVCGEKKEVRAWTRHARTGNRIYPVRKMALAFCVNPECREFRARKKAA